MTELHVKFPGNGSPLEPTGSVKINDKDDTVEISGNNILKSLVRKSYGMFGHLIGDTSNIPDVDFAIKLLEKKHKVEWIKTPDIEKQGSPEGGET